MTMKYIPLIFLFAFMTGCQSLPHTEPVIRAPEILQSVSFNLPNQILRRVPSKESYMVILLLSIDKHGTVDSINIKKSSGYKSIDRHAMRQARQMTFKAATKDNKFVRSNVTLPITYLVS
ncbi:energy transducer TonB [Psychrobacter immobilis]|uniref:energy transducer TonB n=1 Tax=Psychrobacter immobilis TaxID=498 RepID=UPI0039B77040